METHCIQLDKIELTSEDQIIVWTTDGDAILVLSASWLEDLPDPVKEFMLTYIAATLKEAL